MYRQKSTHECTMPGDSSLSCLILNASLKHEPTVSNTGELAELVAEFLKKYQVTTEEVRLADKDIPVGLGFRESDTDEWPGIAEKVRKADIVIFATPIWWGGRSSLMQRVIERLDAFDEEHAATGRSALLNKVAGIVITGSEDGALSTMGSIMMVLTWMNFTLPPECAAYWVGEVGQPVAKDAEKRRMNEATKHMAKNLARNLAFYAKLLKMHPMEVA